MSSETVHIIPAHITNLLFKACEAGRPPTANWNVTMASGQVFMISEKKYNELLSILDANLECELNELEQLQGTLRLYTPVRIK